MLLFLETLVVREMLLALAVIGMVAGSCVAIYQQNVKRLLAYSSVAQVGYIIAGVALVNVTSVSAGIIHLFNHAIIKASLFMVMAIIMYKVGSVRISDLSGLAKRMPITMGAFVASGLALIGVPLSAGFISKWYLIKGAIEEGWWPLSILVGLSSLLVVIYIWRVVELLILRNLLRIKM